MTPLYWCELCLQQRTQRTGHSSPRQHSTWFWAHGFLVRYGAGMADTLMRRRFPELQVAENAGKTYAVIDKGDWAGTAGSGASQSRSKAAASAIDSRLWDPELVRGATHVIQVCMIQFAVNEACLQTSSCLDQLTVLSTLRKELLNKPVRAESTKRAGDASSTSLRASSAQSVDRESEPTLKAGGPAISTAGASISSTKRVFKVGTGSASRLIERDPAWFIGNGSKFERGAEMAKAAKELHESKFVGGQCAMCSISVAIMLCLPCVDAL